MTNLARISASFLLALQSTSLAQVYPFKYYTTTDGLAQATVENILQDSRGFLWFGTRGGVNRYDGNEFRQYLSHGSEKSSVRAILEDTGYTLLVGTYGNGIARFRPEDAGPTWLILEKSVLPGSIVTTFHKDGHGNLWIGTDGGLVVQRPDGSTGIYNDEFGVSLGEIYGIARDARGDLWVAAHAGLLKVTIDAGWRIRARRLITKPARSLLLRQNGDLVVGTSGGGNDKFGVVYRVREDNLDTIVSYRTAGRLVKGQALFEDASSVLWVGTEYGVYRVHDNIVAHIGTRNGLPNENVYCITQDREGTMWFGTGGGGVKLPQPWILSYGMKDGLTSHAVLSLHEDTHGSIWVGMYNGITRIARDGSVRSWDETDGLVHHTVRSISSDRAGRLWVSTPLGFNVIEGGRVRACPVPELRSRIDAWNSIATPAGDLWAGLRGKLVKVAGERVVLALDSTHGLSQDVTQPLCLDRAGRLWFANGRRGLGVYSKEQIRFLTISDGLPDDRVHCVLEDSQRRTWIGTESGVAQWSHKEQRAYPVHDPALTRMAVFVILEDSLGNIWLGTDHGVFEQRETQLQQYSVGEGVANDVIQTGFVSRGGDIWLGTNDGVSRFERLHQPYRVPVPAVYLDHTFAGDASRPVSDRGSVAYDDRSLVFHFNALSYVNEKEMQFQWKLGGLDPRWLSPQRQRQVRYTNLSPGEYTFSVRAANKNGGWSAATSIAFVVLPPYWQTWWFILLCLCAVMSMAYGVYRYRLGHMLKVERMRTRIAADLHDDIASSLSSVALYSDVIQRQLSNVPEESRELLDRIRGLSRETMEKIGLIVWSVDPRRDQVSEVVTFFQRHAVQVCAAAGITFDSAGLDSQATLPLTPEQRRSVYLILKEGLNNIVRHAACSKVSLRCTVEDRTLHVVLTDDGKGFDAAQRESGHGLQNMRSRAASIGAQLSFLSAPGKGTSLDLSLRIA